ncbi:porin [Psychrobacter sp. AH5]|uniref:porin n=1 Tax=Psychrobacter sp. AH5 TaxID=2937433 RepID=UPI003342B09E
MKKAALMLASPVLWVFMTQTAQAEPEIYGKAFMVADYIDQQADYDDRNPTLTDSDESSLQLNSYFSRLGVRGANPVTANTDVIYQLEYGIDIDGDDSDTLQSRDTYLGLKNKDYGELRVGRNSSIFSYLYDPIFNRGYWDNLGTRTLDSNANVAALNMLDYTRSNNSVLWIAPEYQDLQLILQYATDDSFDSSNDGYGAALKLDKGTGYTAAFAYSKDIEASGSLDTLDLVSDDNDIKSVSYGGDAFRGTVTIDLDKYLNITTPITLGAVYQQADYDFKGADKEKGLILSSKIGLTYLPRPASIYVQYNKTDNLNGIGNNDSNQLVVGAEYNVKDNIIAHSYIGQNWADYTSPTDASNSVADIKVFAVGAGLEYLF